MRCVICGAEEHRDADGMVERCPEVRDWFEKPMAYSTMLRDLGWW